MFEHILKATVFGVLVASPVLAAEQKPAPVRRPVAPATPVTNQPAAPAPSAPAANQPATPAPTPKPAPAAPTARPGLPPAQNGGGVERHREASGRDGDLQDQRHRRFDGRRFVSGWAPYTWWFSGNSYWWPGDSLNYGNDESGEAAAASPSVTPTAPTVPGTATPSSPADQAAAQNGLEAMPNYRQAVAELAKAQAAYDSASVKALEELKKNPDYQALVRQRDHAEDKVEAVQAGARVPSPAQVTPAAQKKLDVSSKITRMEQDAINANPQAAAAKARLIDINAQLTTLRKQ
jgi:hypothetical protein